MKFAASVLAAAMACGSALLLAPSPAQAAPIDAKALQKWYYDDYLKVPQVQAAAGSKGKGVTIAVLDSGVDVTLPDFKGADIRDGGSLGAEDKGEGGLVDRRFHGTSVTSIIVGQGKPGNNLVKGIAPEATILSIRLGDGGNTKTSISDAIRSAVDQGADVINMSFSRNDPHGQLDAINPLDREAVEYAHRKGAILVAGAGNLQETGPNVGPPASIPGVIAVAGLNKKAEFWEGGATGAPMGLAAPGVDILGAYPLSMGTEGYGNNTGTSAATAVVSGIAALVKAKHPDLDAANLVNRLTATAVDKGAKGRDAQYGYGAIDALAAVSANVPPVTENPVGDPLAGAAGPAEDLNEPPLLDRIVADYWWVALVVVAAIVLILVIAMTAARRKRPAPVAAGYPPPGSYQPPAYQPAPGYPPQQQPYYPPPQGQQPPPPPPPGYR